jgi:NADPH:quinone reductase-like Zn-dependent oxidoreductase
VNRSDYHVLTGKPFFMRLFLGLKKPKLSCTGTDFAGQVEATGKNVSSFKTGDRLMGFSGGLFSIGSHAQYIVLPEARAKKMVVAMPANINYEEAAACLEGAFYAATQVIPLNPKREQKALVYGASGAIGVSYVQVLKSFGVYVTAVCRNENKELMKSLGADKVIDYVTEDFTKDDERYDFAFDAVGKSSFFKCKKLLKKSGVFTSSGGAENIFLLYLTRLTGGRKVVFAFPKDIPGVLSFITGLIAKGSFRAVIDRKYTLPQIAEAYRFVGTGRKIGNVVITMES